MSLGSQSKLLLRAGMRCWLVDLGTVCPEPPLRPPFEAISAARDERVLWFCARP